MAQYLVLQTKGKNCSVDWVKVILFDNYESAQEFILKNNNLVAKYWTKNEIIESDTAVELYSPCLE